MMKYFRFGMTNFRGINHQFGMLRYDRSRHVYIIGQQEQVNQASRVICAI
ncbi:hypothetical protein GWK75_01380 [Candidatus Saccharibacteria bacterium oral taxon 955]|nr:hypothetical protein GWK75_01380 [Candidatus Saccharibacteria bacterium oral taxon 955]